MNQPTSTSDPASSFPLAPLASRLGGRRARRPGAAWASDPRIRQLAVVLGTIPVLAVLLALLLPPVAMVAGGIWAIVASLRALWTILHLLLAGNLDDASASLPQIDIAVRVGVLCGGYAVLLCALVVLMTGLLGRRWRRLFLLPAAILLPAGFILFVLGTQLVSTAPPGTTSVPLTWHLPLSIYLLLDAVLLAGFLPDARPRIRNARARVRRRQPRVTRKLCITHPLPIDEPLPELRPVRFGPSRPLSSSARLPDELPSAVSIHPDEPAAGQMDAIDEPRTAASEPPELEHAAATVPLREPATPAPISQDDIVTGVLQTPHTPQGGGGSHRHGTSRATTGAPKAKRARHKATRKRRGR